MDRILDQKRLIVECSFGALSVISKDKNVSFEDDDQRYQIWEKTVLSCLSHKNYSRAEELHKLNCLLGVGLPSWNSFLKQAGIKLSNNEPDNTTPAMPPKEIVKKLYLDLKEQNLQEVIIHSTQLITAFPGNFFLWNLIGIAFFKLGELRTAMTAFERAHHLNKSDLGVIKNLIDTYQKSHLLEKAIRLIKGVASTDSPQQELQVNLVELLIQNGEVQEASKVFTVNFCQSSFDFELVSRVISNAVKKGCVSESINFLEALIKEFGGNANVEFQIALLLSKIGPSELAINSYEGLLQRHPKHVDAKINLGSLYYKIGKPGGAALQFIEGLEIDQSNSACRENLIRVLATNKLSDIKPNALSRANDQMLNIALPSLLENTIQDNEINLLVEKAELILTTNGVEGTYSGTQVFRRNAVESHCKRHKSLFESQNIIAKHCFGCFKIQYNPKNIYDLIRLYLLFLQIDLPKNPTRKCMVELRQGIDGNYKGLIYCDSLEHAEAVAAACDRLVQKSISRSLESKIKRGCSEFAVSYPDFESVGSKGNLDAIYKENWVEIEKIFDIHKPFPKKMETPSVHETMCLEDYLIIKNWIRYGSFIGDKSVNKLAQANQRSELISKVI